MTHDATARRLFSPSFAASCKPMRTVAMTRSIRAGASSRLAPGRSIQSPHLSGVRVLNARVGALLPPQTSDRLQRISYTDWSAVQDLERRAPAPRGGRKTSVFPGGFRHLPLHLQVARDVPSGRGD